MFKKLAKIGILLTIKESYLLSKNVFGLGVHPFKTLRALEREKDRSQELLLTGLPIIILAGGAGTVWLGRRLLATSENWGWGAKSLGLMFLLMSLTVGFYLIFWWAKVWLKK